MLEQERLLFPAYQTPIRSANWLIDKKPPGPKDTGGQTGNLLYKYYTTWEQGRIKWRLFNPDSGSCQLNTAIVSAT